MLGSNISNNLRIKFSDNLWSNLWDLFNSTAGYSVDFELRRGLLYELESLRINPIIIGDKSE